MHHFLSFFRQPCVRQQTAFNSRPSYSYNDLQTGYLATSRQITRITR